MSEVNLEFACEEQRSELAYRRKRRRQIFVWSNSVLLAIFGAALATNPVEVSFSIKDGLPERTLVSVLVIMFTMFSISWQHYQRQREAKHQKIISRIYAKMGFINTTDTIYPEGYDNWGSEYTSLWSLLLKPNRITSTGFIGICTIIAVWIDLIF